ncbi:MAG: hypothetical protein QM741_06545 [Rudaea sp.]|uniref:hypothetical protein n=1 Tax=Rudaea sp. TaxID=2136325 RepID=UPI0039E48534
MDAIPPPPSIRRWQDSIPTSSQAWCSTTCVEGAVMRRRTWTTRMVAIGILLPAFAAHAIDGLNYSLQVGLEHSDDMNQSAVNPIGQSALLPQINFDWTERGSVLQADVNGQVQYRDYLGGAFDNEIRGQLSGIVNWIILPQRLSFDFEDYAGVQPVNVFATNAPDNQQQTNVFSLGPTLQFLLGSALKGEADVRLTSTTASVTREFNSQRTSGAFRAIRDLSPTDQLSGNVEAEHVHLTDATGGPDYDRYASYLRYQSKLAQIDLDAALGYSKLDFSQAAGRSGVLARGSLTWHATASSQLEMHVARQFSDAAEDLMIDPATLLARTTGGPIVAGSVPITSQIYLEKRIDVAYAFRSTRFDFRVAPFYEKLDYSIVPGQDFIANGATGQSGHGATLNANYRLRPLWSIGFNASEDTRKYAQVGRLDEDLTYGVDLLNQLTHHWSWRVDLIHNQRSSSVAFQGFRENVAMLTVIFNR